MSQGFGAVRGTINLAVGPNAPFGAGEPRDGCDETHGSERVAAQLEEIGVEGDVSGGEHLGERHTPG
ncbi:MAG: hypothetical protein NTW19_15795 [Planctomycetota bacterium]|nr:hypothetical protein [Planctomycetota bacterium]